MLLLTLRQLESGLHASLWLGSQPGGQRQGREQRRQSSSGVRDGSGGQDLTRAAEHLLPQELGEITDTRRFLPQGAHSWVRSENREVTAL